jgi:hypothetical protein
MAVGEGFNGLSRWGHLGGLASDGIGRIFSSAVPMVSKPLLSVLIDMLTVRHHEQTGFPAC